MLTHSSPLAGPVEHHDALLHTAPDLDEPHRAGWQPLR